MADITVKHEEDEPKEVTLRFSLPDHWNLKHWQTYMGAQQEYLRRARLANQQTDAMSQKFYGCRSLIDAGFVHVSCDENLELLGKFNQYLQTDEPPLSLVGILIENVATEIEAAFELPLA